MANEGKLLIFVAAQQEQERLVLHRFELRFICCLECHIGVVYVFIVREGRFLPYFLKFTLSHSYNMVIMEQSAVLLNTIKLQTSSYQRKSSLGLLLLYAIIYLRRIGND